MGRGNKNVKIVIARIKLKMQNDSFRFAVHFEAANSNSKVTRRRRKRKIPFNCDFVSSSRFTDSNLTLESVCAPQPIHTQIEQTSIHSRFVFSFATFGLTQSHVKIWIRRKRQPNVLGPINRNDANPIHFAKCCSNLRTSSSFLEKTDCYRYRHVSWSWLMEWRQWTWVIWSNKK